MSTTEHEREALYRYLHSKLHSNRSHIPITKSNATDHSLKARLTRCTPQDGPLLTDMMAILDAERNMNDYSNGICDKKGELVEELFEDLLMDYVAVQTMNGENRETRGIEELMEMINCAVVSKTTFNLFRTRMLSTRNKWKGHIKCSSKQS